uniref:Uncharacterized protein n=1 Tax=Candidatus Kentrum sp. TC TaxID=2126339 RepID=A0A450Y9N1_9GAMM|nr:MAG: hypothetical protein BECKTC1821D_GA0114238_10046 [Candidatus Kentron sp. TC]VFK39682.1 MAG: hypothetical protein BECKTC1821E_GA0114239_10058 [Candidatus Kentron sp. TC]
MQTRYLRDHLSREVSRGFRATKISPSGSEFSRIVPRYDNLYDDKIIHFANTQNVPEIIYPWLTVDCKFFIP